MKNDLNINVNLTVDDETAKRAMLILNMYLKDTGRKPDVDICSSVDRKEFYRINMIF